jgi:hypothetical protein
MSHPRSLRSYDDVKQIFDAAVTNEGVRVKCKNAGQAINLRARLNHFRALDRDSMAMIYLPDDPRHGCSAYDPFIVRIVDDTLIIEPRTIGGYTIEPLEKPEEINPTPEK